MKSLMIAAAALLIVVSSALARDRYGSYHRERASRNADIWTGLYIEGGVGATSGNAEIVVPGLGSATFGDTAWSAHLGVGYDHIVAPHLLIGMLARVEWSGISYDVTDSTLGTPLSVSLAENDNPEWMVGGRVGFIPRSDWMVYGLVGYKFADLDIQLDNVLYYDGVQNPSRNGWVLGVGLEAMATECMFVGLEYTAHLGDGDSTNFFGYPFTADTTDHSGKIRAGFKFW